jgi:hypothetical protein
LTPPGKNGSSWIGLCFAIFARPSPVPAAVTDLNHWRDVRGFAQLVNPFRVKESVSGTPMEATGKSEQQQAGPLNGLVTLPKELHKIVVEHLNYWTPPLFFTLFYRVSP